MLWMLTRLGRLHENLIHNRIRLFFFFTGLQVIYFLNLGIENMNSSRHGPAPIWRHCVTLNSFTLFTKLPYLYIILHNGSISSILLQDLNCLFSRRIHCTTIVFSSGWKSFMIPCFFTSSRVPIFCLFVCEPLQQPSQRRKPNAKCDNQTNSKEGVKPWWHEMAFDAALLRAPISILLCLSNIFKPMHPHFYWSATRVGGNEYEMTFLCVCECVHMFEDETRCLPNPKFLCDWCCKCLHLG